MRAAHPSNARPGSPDSAHRCLDTFFNFTSSHGVGCCSAVVQALAVSQKRAHPSWDRPLKQQTAWRAYPLEDTLLEPQCNAWCAGSSGHLNSCTVDMPGSCISQWFQVKLQSRSTKDRGRKEAGVENSSSIFFKLLLLEKKVCRKRTCHWVHACFHTNL